MDSFEGTLQVNKFARRTRHLRVFSKAMVARSHLLDLFSIFASPLIKVWEGSSVISKLKNLANISMGLVSEILPIAPQKRLLSQAVILSVTTIIVTSLTSSGSFTEASMSYSSDYISSYAVPGDILISDEDGYLVKVNPQTNESNRIGLTDYAVHTIANGESLSGIGKTYGLKVETIMWENNLANANSIRAGQNLLIPPVDGVGYKVNSGDSLEKIATKYKISSESIIAQNSLSSETISKGQSLFLPGAKPLYDPVAVANTYRNVGVSRDVRAYTNVSGSSDIPITGKPFIFPTMGSITQGYHAGHYALDIGNRSKPPIWAAGGGTVIKASSGTWGGGYGNHVIIDHGNGLQTLYAHMDSLNVSVGQWVNQGDVVGIMGNTGRVYGVTGIHLHWEVHLNGVKQSPKSYY